MAAIRKAAMVMAAAVIATASAACGGKAGRPQGREADPTRDRECRDPARPKAYFYPAEDRTHYTPDNPFKDGCEILVPDHLFCCPPPMKPAEAKHRPGLPAPILPLHAATWMPLHAAGLSMSSPPRRRAAAPLRHPRPRCPRPNP